MAEKNGIWNIKIYKTNSGKEIILDTSDEACSEFGFKAGQRVKINGNGKEGIVAGVAHSELYNNLQLWFSFNSDNGVTYFGGYDKQRFIDEKFRVIS